MHMSEQLSLGKSANCLVQDGTCQVVYAVAVLALQHYSNVQQYYNVLQGCPSLEPIG